MRKVLPGQPLHIPASDYNAFVDAALTHRSRALNSQNEMDSGTRPSVVLVRNASGQDQERFAALGLSAVIVKPGDNEDDFLNRYAFDAVLPSDAQAGRFVILQEPLKANAIGKAMLSGITPVKIKRSEGALTRYAGIVPGQTTLEADRFGAQILWEEEPPEEEGGDPEEPPLLWALVRIPFGPELPVTCRLVLKDPEQELTGLYVIDGIFPVDGDLILVARDLDTDGIYRLPASGNWIRIAKLKPPPNPGEPPIPDEGVPVLPIGHTISIWDGYSFPNIYVVGMADVWDGDPEGFGEP